MPSGQNLTDDELLDLIEKERSAFSDDYVPLHHEKLDALKKCSNLVAKDRNSISRNTQKRRAHIILTDIWAYLPEVFVLCSLATNPTKLGTLKSRDYLGKLLRWWKEADQPRALLETVERLSEILPSRKAGLTSNDSIPGWQKVYLS